MNLRNAQPTELLDTVLCVLRRNGLENKTIADEAVTELYRRLQGLIARTAFAPEVPTPNLVVRLERAEKDLEVLKLAHARHVHVYRGRNSDHDMTDTPCEMSSPLPGTLPGTLPRVSPGHVPKDGIGATMALWECMSVAFTPLTFRRAWLLFSDVLHSCEMEARKLVEDARADERAKVLAEVKPGA